LTTATLEASLPIAPQKPQLLQSKGNNYFKVSERVMSPIETLLARTPLTISHRLHNISMGYAIARETRVMVSTKKRRIPSVYQHFVLEVHFWNANGCINLGSFASHISP
jgi:hypothetical protein